jgi:hypothetical protein
MPTYTTVRSELKTGDIVLFSGKSAISNVIKLFSGGKWSHVGMVLRLTEFDDGVFLWESTTLTDIPDWETGVPNKGVQLVPLSQRVRNYEGEVLLRRLSKAVSKAMFTRLAELRTELSRRPYERHELELLRAAHDGLFGDSSGEDLSSVFCSELVAEAYQRMGLLLEFPEGLPSNEYTPMDFSQRRKLALLNGYELGPEIPVT